MLSLTYLSSAVETFSERQLDELLDAARVRNEEHEVTGMLLYAGGNFIQTLEGPADSVDALFSRIDADPRHFGVFVVRRDDIDQRQFAGWSMGFRRLSSGDVRKVPGFTDYLDSGRIDGAAARRHAALTFHRVFREHIT